MLDIIAQIGGYLALALIALAVVCIALAERAPVTEDDQYTPEIPFPGPVIKHKTQAERFRDMEEVEQ